MIGILPSTLTNWRSRNTLNFLLLLSKCNNVSLDWLINGEGEKTKPSEKPGRNPEKEPCKDCTCFSENQIKNTQPLFYNESERNPLADHFVEIPLFVQDAPDDPCISPERINGYAAVPRECIRDKNTSFAIRVQEDNAIAGEGIMQNDLLIVDTGLPINDCCCVAVVSMQGKQFLKKLYLREGGEVIAEKHGAPDPVNSGNEIRLLGIVKKVVRDIY